MAAINVYLRITGKASDTGNVWVLFYVNRQKVNFSSGVSCEKKHWNDRKCCVSSGDKDFRDKNLIIEQILARINDVFVKYRLRNKTLTRDAFLRAYHRPDDFQTFFEFITDYQKKISSRLEMSTFMVHKSVIKKMQEFNPDLHFDDITVGWLDDYYSFLRKDLKNNENTAYKNMSTIRKYVRAAFKAGYMDENPFEQWSIRRTKPSYCYLTEDELQKLLNLYNKGELEPHYHKTLEFFLFLCFSSLHVGDAKTLKLEQFNIDSFTYFRRKLRNKKPEPILIPISDPLHKVIHNIVGTRRQGAIFEHLPADQTMNRYLRKIAEIAEINKPISHKVGRHTFATIYLRRTKDLASLKDILGHSELRETLIYAHVLDESKQEGIKVFNDFAV
ncbi:MAG: site-specific integrase [Tannerellaceae bacterium]|jgi:site-specific recombinase XerD|nr:site-specific integrase [Tannerellaceae bacterium]